MDYSQRSPWLFNSVKNLEDIIAMPVTLRPEDILLEQIAGRKVVSFNPVYKVIGKSTVSTLFICQALYWSTRTKDPDGWFYKTQDEWEEETGLTRREQETARKALRAAGVLHEKKQGIPAKLFYRVDKRKVVDILIEAHGLVIPGRTSNDDQVAHASMADRAIQGGAIAPDYLYTENTPETTTEMSLSSYARDQDHDDSRSLSQPQAPSQEPTYGSPVNSEIYDRDRINHDRKDQDQEATPQFRRPPRYPSLAPNPACSTNSTTGHATNGTPWLPMAPWTSRDEYDRFRAFLEARFPGKNRGYIDAICDRVGKGDFENSAWVDFRAGNAPENKAGILHVPQEWLDLVEAEISPVEEAHRGRVHALIMAYNSFRRKYTYSSTGKESKLGTAADDWAKAQMQQLQNS